MLFKILDRLRCIRCSDRLMVECIRCNDKDCIEGFLYCSCNARYPIIDGVAIMIDDIVRYLSGRTFLIARFMNSSKRMRDYIKPHAKAIKPDEVYRDRYEYNGALFKPYSSNSYPSIIRIKDFNAIMADIIVRNGYGSYLELGCGFGYIINTIADRFDTAIGVDLSFSMVKHARSNARNAEFVVADIHSLPFKEFDTVACINVIDLFNDIDDLIRAIKRVIHKGSRLILADPYDFRDSNGDPIELYNAHDIRNLLIKHGFRISNDTVKERFIPWILKINDRAYILYLSDLIIADLI